MKITYILESKLDCYNEEELLGYFTTLEAAKRAASNLYENYGEVFSVKITKLVGQHFGEGYHQIIRTSIDGKKYLRSTKVF